jgi:hypothetical protein
MAAGDDYRIKAADMNAKAKGETRLRTRAELESLALAYLRLADQADRNADLDADLAPLADRSTRSVQQQQQQQPQSKRQREDDTE